MDFNPRSPCGERRCGWAFHRWIPDFNPRSPCGERPWSTTRPRRWRNISIHAPHAGSDRRGPGRSPGPDISIHAPHAGSDSHRIQSVADWIISIHAPHAGSDLVDSEEPSEPLNFNPRSPCGERHTHIWLYMSTHYFNPRSPCGERQPPAELTTSGLISIHAPHAGSDIPGCVEPGRIRDFNPRSPCGERLKKLYNTKERRYFNPRSPCGERLRNVFRCNIV